MGLTAAKEDPNDDTVPQSNAMCKRLCKDDFIPICGTDNVTYRNECFLDCEQKRNRKLSVSWFGDCIDKDKYVEFIEPGIDYDTIENKPVPDEHYQYDEMIKKQMGIKDKKEEENDEEE